MVMVISASALAVRAWGGARYTCRSVRRASMRIGGLVSDLFIVIRKAKGIDSTIFSCQSKV